jgi:DNA repair protein RadC
MAEATRVMDVRLLDHLVIGREGYFSFRERALLSET